MKELDFKSVTPAAADEVDGDDENAKDISEVDSDDEEEDEDEETGSEEGSVEDQDDEEDEEPAATAPTKASKSNTEAQSMQAKVVEPKAAAASEQLAAAVPDEPHTSVAGDKEPTSALVCFPWADSAVADHSARPCLSILVRPHSHPSSFQQDPKATRTEPPSVPQIPRTTPT